VERGAASRFTDGGAHNYAAWSPDGTTIVFNTGLANSGLFFKDIGGAGDIKPTTESPALKLPFDWSRDGRFVLYAEVAPGTGLDLWILPVTREGRPATDVKARPYLRTPFYESHGRFSPETNLRWIAYVSDESGRYEIYIDTFPEPRHKTPISTGGGLYPAWGAGGRELYYVSPDLKLMAVSLKLGADSAEPSAPRELFPLPAVDTGFTPYDVAPDGQRFLVRATPQQQAAEPLTVIVNWPALLKKGLAAP
jgi:Tol biopolymer transport system component